MRLSQKAALVLVAFVTGILGVYSCGGSGGGSGSASAPQGVAFYTSSTGSGDLSSWVEVSGTTLTGLEAADAICQTRADDAGLTGTFVAWLSDDVDDAYCRAQGLIGKKADNCGQSTLPVDAGPWFRTDGAPFLDRIDLALDLGVIYYPMRVNEIGSISYGFNNYWTGTTNTGEAHIYNCSNWTVTTGFGSLGSSYATGLVWSNVATSPCTGGGIKRSLLCVETGTGNALPAPDAQGNMVFVSSVTGNGNLGGWTQAGVNTGIAAGDAICQDLAFNAGLPNPSTFRAWLSDSSVDAVNSLTSPGPWVRPDGVMVAESTSALVNSWLISSINVTENGDYVGTGSSAVWTGTLGSGIKSSVACSDWTGSSSSNTGTSGRSYFADISQWSERSSLSCATGATRLYCFEDN